MKGIQYTPLVEAVPESWEARGVKFPTEQQAKNYLAEYWLALGHLNDVPIELRHRETREEYHSRVFYDKNIEGFEKEYKALCVKYHMEHVIEEHEDDRSEIVVQMKSGWTAIMGVPIQT